MSILNIQHMGDIFGGETGIQAEILLRCNLIEKLLENDTFPD
jgi:hypothetical protein